MFVVVLGVCWVEGLVVVVELLGKGTGKAVEDRRGYRVLLLGCFRLRTRSLSSAVGVVETGKLVGKRCC